MARKRKTRNFSFGDTLKGFFTVLLSMLAFVGVLYVLTAIVKIAVG